MVLINRALVEQGNCLTNHYKMYLESKVWFLPPHTPINPPLPAPGFVLLPLSVFRKTVSGKDFKIINAGCYIM